MQCPETPRFVNSKNFDFAFATSVDTGTARKRPLSIQHHIRDVEPQHEAEYENITPCRGPLRARSHQKRLSFDSALPKKHVNFSRQFNTSDDVFSSRTRSSVPVLQFHEAARRLALSPLSSNPTHPVVNRSSQMQTLIRQSKIAFEAYNDEVPCNTALPTNPASDGFQDRDITSAYRETMYSQCRSPESVFTPTQGFKRASLHPCRPPHSKPNLLPSQRMPSKAPKSSPTKLSKRNFSRPTYGTRISPVKTPKRNFSRPIQKRRQEQRQSTSSKETGNWTVGLPTDVKSPLRPTNSTDHDFALDVRPYQIDETLPTIEEVVDQVQAADAHQAESAHVQSPEAASTHDSIRESFDSAVIECLSERRLQLSNWEIWSQRILFSLLIFTVNIALGLAYLGAFKHPYLLAILVFMKSKDILSTLADILGLLHNSLRSWIWPPKKPDPRWILSLVCAYAETEEQILKTVYSLARSRTQPHRQVICIILDGKPRDILGKMSSVKATVQRPYTAWRGNRGEIKVFAGHIEGTPIVLVEKAKNAGKKDSLILGHDLFNFPRKDMPQSTKMLRREVWQVILPSVITKQKGNLEAFDFVFCTDADSTIHEHALQRLANALCREDNAIAGCGVLFAEAGDKKTEYSPWHLFQQFQYTFGQYVRRQAESLWGRVTCLPGCITMIVVRPEVGYAISEYARPVTEHNLFRHQVQYLGTDRRLTWCMMSQGKHLRTVFVPDALSETVVPNSVSHYLSQRRRWASNAYFNDYFYLLGPRQRLITRLFAAIDIVRLTLVYYRVFNTGYFLHNIITNFYVIKIIPTLIITKTPATWYLILVLIREPFLRRRLHKILLGMCINQIISPVLSVIVFTNVLFHMGSQAWGKTGASTQGPAPGSVPPTTTTEPKESPLKAWTPRRLAKSVRTAIHGVTPRFSRSKNPPMTFTPNDNKRSSASEGSNRSASTTRLPSTVSSALSSEVGNRTPDQIISRTSIATRSCIPSDRHSTRTVPINQTPIMRKRQNSFSTPAALVRRTPYHHNPKTLSNGVDISEEETPVKTKKEKIKAKEISASGMSFDD